MHVHACPHREQPALKPHTWQDTNLPQYALIQQLAAPSGGRASASVFVVGDADQSIYGWRGADFTNVERFSADFGAGRILLETNYRSTSTIVQAAQSIIERNAGRIDKRMISSKAGGAPIRLHQVWGDQDEATFVAQQAKRLVESGAVAAGFREISVMYRTNQQSRIMEEMFVRNGVPYQLIGATKFYERREVKDLLAYLRVLANPDDSVSLLRIINVPTRGIGKATLERLQGLASMWGCSVFQALMRLRDCRRASAAAEERESEDTLDDDVGRGDDKQTGAGAGAGVGYPEYSVDDLDAAMASLETALQNMPAGGGGVGVRGGAGARGGAGRQMGAAERAALQAGLKERAVASLERFSDVMVTLREGASLCSPAETLDLVIQVIDFKEHLNKDETFDDRWANVGELCKAAARTDEAGIDGLALFLEEVALVAGDDSITEESIDLDLDVKKDPRVKLMTLHSSKGLEFDVVFMTGLVEGQLPHVRSMKSVDEVEEERRLAYVGMTRARELLYMTWYKTVYGRGRPADREDPDTWLEPSRFLKDVPESLRNIISFDKAAVEQRLAEPLKGSEEWTPAAPAGARGGRGQRGRGVARQGAGWAGRAGRRGRGQAVTQAINGKEVARLYEAAVRGKGGRSGGGRKGGSAPREKGPFDD